MSMSVQASSYVKVWLCVGTPRAPSDVTVPMDIDCLRTTTSHVKVCLVMTSVNFFTGTLQCTLLLCHIFRDR